MGTFFAVIFFISAVSILVFLAISVYMFFFQKDNYKKWLVRAGIAIGVLIVSVIGGVSTSSTPEQRAEMEQKRIAEQAQKEQEKAEKEARKPQEVAEKKEREDLSTKKKEAQATKEEAAINNAIPETVQEMKDKRYHPMVADAYIEVDYNKKLVTMTMVVNPTTDKSAALELADTMIRRFSSNVLTHDSSFTAPSGNSYGSLFDKYDIAIAVAQVQHKDDRSKWLYDQYITKGMHTKQGPDWKNAK